MEHVSTLHDAGAWWSQTIAIGYERLRGLRELHERSDGRLAASASKTLSVTDSTAHAWFTDPRKRLCWLTEAITIRTTTAPRAVRFTWPDETSVAVRISAKGDARCVVAIEHTQLASESEVAARKQFWKAALGRLALDVKENP